MKTETINAVALKRELQKKSRTEIDATLRKRADCIIAAQVWSRSPRIKAKAAKKIAACLALY